MLVLIIADLIETTLDGRKGVKKSRNVNKRRHEIPKMNNDISSEPFVYLNKRSKILGEHPIKERCSLRSTMEKREKKLKKVTKEIERHWQTSFRCCRCWQRSTRSLLKLGTRDISHPPSRRFVVLKPKTKACFRDNLQKKERKRKDGSGASDCQKVAIFRATRSLRKSIRLRTKLRQS